MPSDVLDFVREQRPEFAQVPDDLLTQFIGGTHPEFLRKDPAFSNDYSRIVSAAPGGSMAGLPAGGEIAIAPMQTEAPVTPPGTFPESPLARFTPEQIAAQEEKAGQPLFELVKPLTSQERAALSPTQVGMFESVRQNANALTTPENLDLLVVGGGIANLGKWAARGVAAAFAAMMGRQVPEIASELGKEMGQAVPDRERIAKLMTDAAIATGFTGLAISPMAKGVTELAGAEPSLVVPRVNAEIAPTAPITAEAVKQTLTEFKPEPKPELPTAVPTTEVKNAIPVESPNAEVLRPEQPQVELPQVGARNVEPEKPAPAQVAEEAAQTPPSGGQEGITSPPAELIPAAPEAAPPVEPPKEPPPASQMPAIARPTVQPPSAKQIPPNHSFIKVVNYDGKTVAVVSFPHDGTLEGIKRASKQAHDYASANYAWKDEFYNTNSQNGATDAAGNVKWVVWPEAGKIADVSTPEASYMLGDLKAHDKDLARRIIKARDAGDVQTVNSLVSARVNEAMRKATEHDGYAVKHEASYNEALAKKKAGESVQSQDDRFSNWKDYLSNLKRHVEAQRKYAADYRAEAEKWGGLFVKEAKASVPAIAPATEASGKEGRVSPQDLYLSWSPKSGGTILGESTRTSPEVIDWANQQIKGLREEVRQYRDEEKRNREAYKTSPNRRVMGGLAPESLRAMGAKSKKLESQAKIDFLKSRILEHQRIVQATKPPTPPTPGEGMAGPGSPSISQGPDPKAAIEALEESFRNIKGPKPSLSQQVKDAFAVGEKTAQVKEGLGSALQGLKSAGDYLINKWKGIPRWDDMLRAKGELSAELEKRGWRVRQFVSTVKKAMPTARQRAAIAKWVDAGGDRAELERGLSETQPRYRQAYEDALNLKGDDLIAAQNIQSYFEARLDDAMEAGVLQQGVEDYIHRIYERKPKLRDKALAYVQSGLLQQNPGLVKKRIFQFDWEAEKAGLKPVQDFLPRIAQYESSLSRAIAAREFVKKMTEMKAEDGRPVIDTAGIGVPAEGPEGGRAATLIKPSFKPGEEGKLNNRRDYVARDYPALRRWKWASTDAAGKPIMVQGDLLVHPDYAGRVDALLEPSRVRYGRYPRVGRGALGASSTVKQTMLDLSGFHQVQITLHGMEHKVMPWRIIDEIDFNNPKVEGLLKGGVTIGGDYYASHYGEGLVGSSLTRHLPFLGPLLESYHSWLFQNYIPRIKMTMALNALERNLKRYGDTMTEEQIYAKTAAEANSAFGELNYTMLERSKTARDISRLILLAPDFLEARGRFALGSLEKGGKFGSHEQRAALLLGALAMYVTARILNKTVDDKWHFEPENAFSLVHNGHSYSLRTVQGDVLHLLDKPLQFWMNRLNPVYGRTLLEMATGRDAFGRKRSVSEALWDSAKNTMPISLRSSREQRLWESIANSMGLVTRRWNDVDKAFRLAEDWKKEHGIQERGEFIYDPEKDPYRGLKIALSHNDDAAAVKEIQAIYKAGISRDKLRQYFNRYASLPFTGSRGNDKKWMATLTEDQRAIVDGAREHKQAMKRLFEQALAKAGKP